MNNHVFCVLFSNSLYRVSYTYGKDKDNTKFLCKQEAGLKWPLLWLHFLPSLTHLAFCHQHCLLKDHLIITAGKLENWPSGNSLLWHLKASATFRLTSYNSPPCTLHRLWMITILVIIHDPRLPVCYTMPIIAFFLCGSQPPASHPPLKKLCPSLIHISWVKNAFSGRWWTAEFLRLCYNSTFYLSVWHCLPSLLCTIDSFVFLFSLLDYKLFQNKDQHFIGLCTSPNFNTFIGLQ